MKSYRRIFILTLIAVAVGSVFIFFPSQHYAYSADPSGEASGEGIVATRAPVNWYEVVWYALLMLPLYIREFQRTRESNATSGTLASIRNDLNTTAKAALEAQADVKAMRDVCQSTRNSFGHEIEKNRQRIDKNRELIYEHGNDRED